MIRQATTILLGMGSFLVACGPPQPDPVTAKADPPPAQTCPEGQVWKDGACAAAPGPACPDGQVETNGACAPAPVACAPGTHPGEPGKPCVPDAPTAQASAAPKSPCPEGMAFIKGGSYKMGIVKVDVTVADICMDLTEATAKDYEACVDKKKCNTNLVNGCPGTSTYKVAGREDHPMVCIDYTQATDYCEAQGKRLPTEGEWEWAARGGDKANVYSWGNDPPGDNACWSGVTALTASCPVKAHPKTATPQGLLGMSGNVFEWVTRALDAKIKGRAGRGGSWRDSLPNVLRTDRPGSFEVTYRCGFLGVRCVTDPDATASAAAAK